MEGWGVSSPITVAFERAAGADPRDAAIDLEDVARRMAGRRARSLERSVLRRQPHDRASRSSLDVGKRLLPGHRPRSVPLLPERSEGERDEPRFETVEEGAGLPQAAYRPELDRDFDGVLDHPNTPRDARGIAGRRRPPHLVRARDRHADPPARRPARREDGVRGRPHRSPARRRTAAGALAVRRASIIRRSARASTRLQDWLHRQAPRELLRRHRRHRPRSRRVRVDVHDAAHARGHAPPPRRPLRQGALRALRRASSRPSSTRGRVAGPAPARTRTSAPGWETRAACVQARAGRRTSSSSTTRTSRSRSDSCFKQVFGLDAGRPQGGRGRVREHRSRRRRLVQVAVPDGRPGIARSRHALPRRLPDRRRATCGPTTCSGSSSSRRRSGEPSSPSPSRSGVTASPATPTRLSSTPATTRGRASRSFGYNNPGHGLVLRRRAEQRDRRRRSSPLNCLVPFLGAITHGRAHDSTATASPDSGAFWWTAHIFHTRDNVRQGDPRRHAGRPDPAHRSTAGVGTQDFNGDGKPDIAGDFDGDGVPDVGGPNVSYFAAGESLGGIMSGIQGGIDPYIIAAAPMSAAAALAIDVAFRSYGVVESVTAQLMGPCRLRRARAPSARRAARTNASSRSDRAARPTQRSVRISVNDGDRESRARDRVPRARRARART